MKKDRDSRHQSNSFKGSLLEVKIHAIEKDRVWVGYDDKSDFDIPIEEFEGEDIKLGYKTTVYKTKNKDGKYRYSKKEANLQNQMLNLDNYREDGTPIEGHVKKIIEIKTKKIFIVEFFDGMLEGRCLPRNIDLFKQKYKDVELKDKDLEKYIGLKDKFIVTNIINPTPTPMQKERAPIVFVSRKDCLLIQRKKEFDEFFEKTNEGDVVKAKVTSYIIPRREEKPPQGEAEQKEESEENKVEKERHSDHLINDGKEYVIVFIGPVRGLIEKEELSWGYVTKLRNFLKKGEEVDLKVTEIDKEKKLVKLSYRAMFDNPWLTFADRHSANDVVSGVVTNIKEDLGAFVEIEKGIEGMIHISDVSWLKNKPKISDILSIGQKIDVKIIGFDLEQKKISLGIKQLQENPFDKQYQKGTKLTKKISKILDKGIVFELEKGLEGFVAAEDISWTEYIKDINDHYKVDQEIETVVLSSDNITKRVKLGIKQLQENPLIKLKNIKSSKVLEIEVVEKNKEGLVVDLGDAILGLIPEKEIVGGPYNTGDKVKCVIINIKNMSDYKVILSMKKFEAKETRQDIQKYFSASKSSDDKITLRDILNKERDT